MKVKSKSKKTKMFLYIKQDERPAIELGIVPLVEAMKQAHKLAKSYLYAHLAERETRVEVKTQTETITTIDARRNGGAINIIHS